jgi:arylsulfatase A-like enzyme
LFGCRQGNFKYIYNASTDVSVLYDLDKDPGEATNIAGQHPEKLKEMNTNLHAWMRYQADFMADAMRKTRMFHSKLVSLVFAGGRSAP